MYDMPWLGAVLRKLSQTPCLTLSTPSHQTGRNLSRLQFKNWTREQFHCDFWKLSLQHSPLSLAAPEAQTGPHVHITNTSSLAPPPCSPGLIPGSWQGALAIPQEGQEWHWGRALLSSQHWDSLSWAHSAHIPLEPEAGGMLQQSQCCSTNQESLFSLFQY